VGAGTAAPTEIGYIPVSGEATTFRAAFEAGLGIMLKGPTGCGKTKLVEHMAHLLGVPLFTVACHEDITASDLLGRWLLVGGDTVWVDGPLTRAVREGGICYLDEVVEARQDSIVAIHPLADHRRTLTLERHGGTRLDAAEGFGLVVSYNPGYQSVLKDLKVSTRQRFISIELGYPPPDIETQILIQEAEVEPGLASELVRLGSAIRRLENSGLKEVASTRTLIAAGRLVGRGLGLIDASLAAVAGPLTDDPALAAGLAEMIRAFFIVEGATTNQEYR
jgi:nitric oxide reductase NorQ protein